MTHLFNAMSMAIKKFARDEEGAQIIEYGLIIAVVSLVLIGLLGGLSGTDGAFTKMVDKVKVCLGGTVTGVTCR